MPRVLLIDDDVIEHVLVKRILHRKYGASAEIDCVTKMKDAVAHVLETRYDYILLDNILTDAVNVQFSLKFLHLYTHGIPIIVISNDISVDYLQDKVDYLQDKEALGVADVVDKAHLKDFLEAVELKAA